MFPTGRKSRRRNQSPAHNDAAKRVLQVETLECRRLLAADHFIDFQRPEIFGGAVEGTKWEDLNGNGQRESNERGLAGVTIYADVNNNGQLDGNEPWTRSQRGTFFNPGGGYRLRGLPPGEYSIREVVPEAYQQTFPASSTPANPAEDEFLSVEPRFLELKVVPGEIVEQSVSIAVHPFCIRPFEFDVVALRGDEIGVPGVEVINHSGIQVNGCGGEVSKFQLGISVAEPGPHSFDLGFFDHFGGDIVARIPVTINGGSRHGGHLVAIQPGTRIRGLDFGNQPVQPQTGSIEGRKWLDRDGDGQLDPGEPGLGGVDIYLDLNNNRRLDRHEPRTRTQYENPVTDFDEGGFYFFGGLRAGTYTVREVIPHGFVQTYPTTEAVVTSSETGRFADGIALDFDVTDIQFHRQGLDSKVEIEVSVLWPNGCGEILTGKTAQAQIGTTILVDMHGTQVGEVCTEALKTQSVTVAVSGLEQGEFQVVGTLHEELSDGEKATLGVVGGIRLGPNDSHRVTVEPGGVVSNVNFGNLQIGSNAALHGLKWRDDNSNGRREENEPGLPGVTIYADLNTNRRFDEGEPIAVTMEDDPNTPDVDETGRYSLDNLKPRRWYSIREVVPEGFRQTFPFNWHWVPPRPFLGHRLGDFAFDVLPWPSGQHLVFVEDGAEITDINFGNTPVAVIFAENVTAEEAAVNDPRKPGDVDEDGQVNFTDFLVLSSNFGSRVDAAFADGDFDEDGIVTFADFLVLSANFGG